jgi:hypothetical protein
VDTLTFLAKLAWPLVVVIIVVVALCIFRRPIAELIGRVRRAKIPWGVDVTLDPQDVAPEDPKIVALADAKVAELARELEHKLEPRLVQLEQQQTTTSQALYSVMHEVGHALVASRRVDEEAREETVSEGILSALRTAHRALTVDEIITLVTGGRPGPRTIVEVYGTIGAIRDMESEGKLHTSTDTIGLETEVSLVNK